MVGWGASWWRRVWAGLVRPAATHAQAANSPKAAGGGESGGGGGDLLSGPVIFNVLPLTKNPTAVEFEDFRAYVRG